MTCGMDGINQPPLPLSSAIEGTRRNKRFSAIWKKAPHLSWAGKRGRSPSPSSRSLSALESSTRGPECDPATVSSLPFGCHFGFWFI
ncbi:hypothetical protein AVEN_220263-1 [Araneus ventricosus]|uniref:Uncharacterized protein n=1 Tax=Araneus ventricosus TaxID=182803 RepID=A0A4Y2KEI8_ARAVE|nr:hypothetical protein AVEN_220263-1 [Araneus ventricosus]